MVSGTINTPLPVDIVQINTTDILCKGDASGTASLSVNGGTPPFTYQWSGTNQNGTVVSGLAAGSYTVTATDVNGCYDIDTFIISEPLTSLNGVLVTQDALCNGSANGEIGAIVQGGTPGYSYLWDNGQTTAVADSIAAGTYTVLVTDANGCTLSLTGSIGEATVLNISASVIQDVTCYGGSDGVAFAPSASGGTPAYSYVWSDALGQTSQLATGLSAGAYTVVVTDSNFCTASATVTVTEADQISVVEQITDVSCNGGSDGSINIVNSNTVLSNFVWTAGVGNPLLGLSAGSYGLTVTDVNGCQESFSFAVMEPSALEMDLVQTSGILCYGDSTGAASVSASGGSPNYQILWSTGQATPSINALGPGNYGVTVTDSKGCSVDTSFALNMPEELLIAGSTTGTLCTGDNTGTLTIQASGGTVTSGLLQYSIDSVVWQEGNNFSGLSAGIYSIYVMDENGCVSAAQVFVEDAAPFFITEMTADTTLEYLDSVEVSAMVNDSGSVAVVSWEQLEGAMVGMVDSGYSFVTAPTEKVSYQFTAIDSNGCRVDSIVIIDVTKPRRANAPNAFTPNGDGVNDYFFIQGGTKVEKVTLFRIYDRWGELVFEGSDLEINIPEQGWNGIFRGMPSSSGAYAWYADVLFKDGETIQIKGDVILLR